MILNSDESWRGSVFLMLKFQVRLVVTNVIMTTEYEQVKVRYGVQKEWRGYGMVEMILGSASLMSGGPSLESRPVSTPEWGHHRDGE